MFLSKGPLESVSWDRILNYCHFYTDCSDSEKEADLEAEEDGDSILEERSILASPVDDVIEEDMTQRLRVCRVITQADVAQRLRVFFDLETTGLGRSSRDYISSCLHSVCVWVYDSYPSCLEI